MEPAMAILPWHRVCNFGCILIQSLPRIPMPEPVTIPLPPIVGQVVEIYDDEGRSTAKIALRACHIELPLSLLDEAHLDDEVRLDLLLRSDRIRTVHTNGLGQPPRPDHTEGP